MFAPENKSPKRTPDRFPTHQFCRGDMLDVLPPRWLTCATWIYGPLHALICWVWLHGSLKNIHPKKHPIYHEILQIRTWNTMGCVLKDQVYIVVAAFCMTGVLTTFGAGSTYAVNRHKDLAMQCIFSVGDEQTLRSVLQRRGRRQVVKLGTCLGGSSCNLYSFGIPWQIHGTNGILAYMNGGVYTYMDHGSYGNWWALKKGLSFKCEDFGYSCCPNGGLVGE